MMPFPVHASNQKCRFCLWKRNREGRQASVEQILKTTAPQALCLTNGTAFHCRSFPNGGPKQKSGSLDSSFENARIEISALWRIGATEHESGHSSCLRGRAG